MKKLTIEINPKLVIDKPVYASEHGDIFITPPLDEDYWVLRCKVSPEQALLVFPKFGMYGCGFAKEKNWNIRIPIAWPAEQIWDHIKENRADASGKDCLEALHLLRKVAKEMGLFDEEFEDRLKSNG